MPSSHLTLCHPLLLLPSVFPSIRAFSNESVLCIKWSKYWSFCISPSSEYSVTLLNRYFTKCFLVQGEMFNCKLFKAFGWVLRFLGYEWTTSSVESQELKFWDGRVARELSESDLWLDFASLSSQPTEAFLSLCVEKNCRVSQKSSWTFWRAHYNWNRSSGKMYVRLRVAGNARGIVRQQFLCHWLMNVLDNTCALAGLTGFRNSPENWERPEWKSPSRWRWEPWPQITASSQIYIGRVPRGETRCVSPAFKNIHFFLKM